MLANKLSSGRPKAGAHLSGDRGERDGGQRVLEAEEVVRRLVSDQVGAGGERLAELDRGGADRLERVGIARLGGHARAEAGDAREAADGLGRVRIALDAGQRPVAREDAAPEKQAPEMDGGRGHSLSPPPSGEGVGVGQCRKRRAR